MEEIINREVCSSLKTKNDEILSALFSESLKEFPDLRERYGDQGIERTKEDLSFHLQYLTTAVCLNDKFLFIDYVKWLKMFFHHINLPLEYQLKPLQHIKQVLSEKLPEKEKVFTDKFLDPAIEGFSDFPTEMNSFLSPNNDLNVSAQQYLSALLRKDRAGAERVIFNEIEKGTSVKEIYLNIFQLVQWEIGRLWQHNKISVAMEHFCTAATQFIMSRLYEHIFSTEKIGKSMVATSVSGELHEIGIRMVTDFFEMEGWDTYYLGSNTPHSSVLKMIEETNSELLAISSTIPFNVPKVVQLISAARAAYPDNGLKILVGGTPFNQNRELWKEVKADGFAIDAQSAVDLMNRWKN